MVGKRKRHPAAFKARVALEAAKRKGVKLGTHNPACKGNSRKGQRNGLAKAVAAAASARGQARSDCYSLVMPEVHAMRLQGRSFAAIAAHLNDAGHVTTTGKAFAAMTVQRLLG